MQRTLSVLGLVVLEMTEWQLFYIFIIIVCGSIIKKFHCRLHDRRCLMY